MSNLDIPLVKEDESCSMRVSDTDPPDALNNPIGFTIYENDILDIARVVYYFSYLLPPAMGAAYKVLKVTNSTQASAVRDCIIEPRLSLVHLERLLRDHGFDIASLK